jgi:hypothetical protein
MQYVAYGPMTLARDQVLTSTSKVRSDWWDQIENEFHAEGLRDACGCYVFAMRAGKGTRPWYVGLAQRSSFQHECFTPDKKVKYQGVLNRMKGTPLLYFYARTTPTTHAFSKPTRSGYGDVVLLEQLLIGAALERNDDLINIKATTLLKNMVVPGFINSAKGKLPPAASELKKVMGY